MMLTLLSVPALPGHLREQVLLLAGDISPDSVAFPGRVTHRMESFGANGFAVQVTKPSGSRLPGSYVLAGGAVAAVVLLGGGIFLASHIASHSGQPTAFESPRVAVTALPQANGFTKPLLVARSSSPASVTAPAPRGSITASSNGQSSANQPYSYSPTPTTAPTTILLPPTTAAPTTAAPTPRHPRPRRPPRRHPRPRRPPRRRPRRRHLRPRHPPRQHPRPRRPQHDHGTHHGGAHDHGTHHGGTTTTAPTTAAPTTAAPTTAAPRPRRPPRQRLRP